MQGVQESRDVSSRGNKPHACHGSWRVGFASLNLLGFYVRTRRSPGSRRPPAAAAADAAGEGTSRGLAD